MDRRTLRVAVVAALCIVALAAAAATVDTAQRTGGALGPGEANDPGIAPGDKEGESGASNISGDDREEFFVGGPAFGTCIPYLRSLEFLLFAAVVLLTAIAALTLYRNLLMAVASVLAVGMPVFVLYLFFAACPESASRDGMAPRLNNSTIPSGGGMPGMESGTSPATPSIVVLLLLGLVLLVAAVVVLRGTGDDDAELAVPEEPDDDEEAVEAIGRVAGEAADRIDAAGDLDNEVYRAWREMVGLLDVDSPATTTPGEFADAAAAAGMDRTDVDELTDLFEAVRYGGVDPSADREERAVAALRRIERKYGSDAGGGWS